MRAYHCFSRGAYSTGLQLIHINVRIVSERTPIVITKRALSGNWGCRNKIRALSGPIRVQQIDTISYSEAWCLHSLIQYKSFS